MNFMSLFNGNESASTPNLSSKGMMPRLISGIQSKAEVNTDKESGLTSYIYDYQSFTFVVETPQEGSAYRLNLFNGMEAEPADKWLLADICNHYNWNSSSMLVWNQQQDGKLNVSVRCIKEVTGNTEKDTESLLCEMNQMFECLRNTYNSYNEFRNKEHQLAEYKSQKPSPIKGFS